MERACVRLQDRLLNEIRSDRVERIAASHSAYFSEPDEDIIFLILLNAIGVMPR